MKKLNFDLMKFNLLTLSLLTPLKPGTEPGKKVSLFGYKNLVLQKIGNLVWNNVRMQVKRKLKMWRKGLGGLDLTGRIKLILKQKLDLKEMTHMAAAKK
jgi:hypothetical protein